MTNRIEEDGAPANGVGGGAIAGVGVGKDGEPGYKLKKKMADTTKYLTRLKSVRESILEATDPKKDKQTDTKKDKKPDAKQKPDNSRSLSTSKGGAGDDVSNSMASELFARARALATTTHFAHLSIDSYSEHQALSEFYTDIIGEIDTFCESYIGLYGKFITLPPIQPEMKIAEVAIAEFRAWIGSNRELISDDSSIQNIIDEIVELCNTTIYKLQKLS